jgi:predicted outer membrane lipoprotein
MNLQQLELSACAFGILTAVILYVDVVQKLIG